MIIVSMIYARIYLIKFGNISRSVSGIFSKCPFLLLNNVIKAEFLSILLKIQAMSTVAY